MADPRTSHQQAAQTEPVSSGAQIEQGTSRKRKTDERRGGAKKQKTKSVNDSADEIGVEWVPRAKASRIKNKTDVQDQATLGTTEVVGVPAPVEDAASAKGRIVEASSKSAEEVESALKPAQEDGHVEGLSKQVTEQTKTIAELEHALNQAKNQLVQVSTERDEAKIERDKARIERDQMKSLTGVFTNIITELATPKVVVKPTKGSKPTAAQLAKLKQPLIGKSAYQTMLDAAVQGRLIRSEGDKADAARRGAFDRRQEALVGLVLHCW
ncbi:hypothetical protein LTR56_002913 [Elasticomyces elasticus]|nr:hypothetical protein LTR56_002913 [Elasticomyces elasticus]KAK3665128.1 hypothetical protein LTR22_003934 [Elasticomyces elasticus]KAK4930699.1 hypothetical protein LTR49_002787 [Elasticomyces elasticus]KAK5759922.1 hypothetical protein LTS12_009970 [Elasticomyces elasticus]